MIDQYQGYEVWKGWDDDTFMQLGELDRAYYRREIGGLELRGEKALEIGFGNGTLLAFLAEQGARLHGTELSRNGIRLAEARDITVLSDDLSQVGDSHDGSFRLIAAFDVLEHLERPEAFAMMREVARLLAPGGRFVARFPNGQSPFGLINQAGDVTHISLMSLPIMEQIVAGLPLKLVAVGDDQPIRIGSRWQRAKGLFRRALRSLGSRIVRYVFAAGDMPLSINMTVTYERIDRRSTT